MNFACRNFSIDEVVRCSLELTKSEFRILEFLMKHAKRISSQEIAKTLKLELSTVQRSMKKLSSKKIVRKSQINLSSGGYSFFYCICDKREIKSIIKQIIQKWYNEFDQELNKW
jgi:predicted transcriptional regulator